MITRRSVVRSGLAISGLATSSVLPTILTSCTSKAPAVPFSVTNWPTRIARLRAVLSRARTRLLWQRSDRTDYFCRYGGHHTGLPSTKEVGKGTGLGLSISYQIVVETHQGKLECRSNSKQGTEFWIELPIGFEYNSCTS